MVIRHLSGSRVAAIASGRVTDSGRTLAKADYMSIYRQFGVEPVINASGGVTRLGGSPMPREVVDAFRQAATEPVLLEQLQAAASRQISEKTSRLVRRRGSRWALRQFWPAAIPAESNDCRGATDSRANSSSHASSAAATTTPCVLPVDDWSRWA